MLIKSFTGADGNQKLRITEEFSSLLVITKLKEGATAGSVNSIGNEVLHAYLERSGKNIDIVNRQPLKHIIDLSCQIMTQSPIKMANQRLYNPVLLFEDGNFKFSDSDACIVELTNLNLNLDYLIYGVVDMDKASGIYYYESKTMLVGEHVKTYDLQGIERILLPQDAKFNELSFFVLDENGKEVERKFTPDELLFLWATQTDMNPLFKNDVLTFENNIVLAIDGISAMKVYSDSTRTEIIDFLFQSRYVDGSESYQTGGYKGSVSQNVLQTSVLNNNLKVASNVKSALKSGMQKFVGLK